MCMTEMLQEATGRHPSMQHAFHAQRDGLACYLLCSSQRVCCAACAFMQTYNNVLHVYGLHTSKESLLPSLGPGRPGPVQGAHSTSLVSPPC